MKNEFSVDFIGIGAPKAGTTWLAAALEAHPEIGFSASKATEFFSIGFHSDRGNYMRFNGVNAEQYSLFFRRCKPGLKVGEFTVSYFANTQAAEAIYRVVPGVKIIAVLREPVSRLISHHRFAMHTNNRERRPLQDFIHPDDTLVRRGMYGENLERYFSRFPRENIKVIIYEEMKANPSATLRDLYAFLGVDADFVPHELIGRSVNATTRTRWLWLRILMRKAQYAMIWLGIEAWVSGSMKARAASILERFNNVPIEHEPVTEDTKASIRALYRDDRRKLERLLDRDLTPLWGAP